MFYETNDVEMELLEERTRRFDPSLRDTLWNLIKDMNLQPPIDEEFWGEWIEQNVKSDVDTPHLDPHYIMPYWKLTGFKIALDGIHGTPT